MRKLFLESKFSNFLVPCFLLIAKVSKKICILKRSTLQGKIKLIIILILLKKIICFSDKIEKLKEKRTIHTIIIDCSSIFYIDCSGVETLIEIIEELRAIDVELYLASCSTGFTIMLERTEFFEKVQHANVCPTVHDAVVERSAIPFDAFVLNFR